MHTIKFDNSYNSKNKKNTIMCLDCEYFSSFIDGDEFIVSGFIYLKCASIKSISSCKSGMDPFSSFDQIN